MRHEALSERGRELFPELKKFKGFYLAGGTALALQIGHRLSVDFDLFGGREIDKKLLAKVKEIFRSRKTTVSINNKDELTVFIDGVKVTFLYYPFPPLSAPVRYRGLPLLPVKEIAAAKAYAIGRRGTYKDYIDLYFIISKSRASLEEIIELAVKKYGSDFNARLFLEQLLYFDDLEEQEIILLKNVREKLSRQKLEEFFKRQIKKIKL